MTEVRNVQGLDTKVIKVDGKVSSVGEKCNKQVENTKEPEILNFTK